MSYYAGKGEYIVVLGGHVNQTSRMVLYTRLTV